MSDNSNGTNTTEPGSVGTVRVRVAGLTDVGRVREHNEDNYMLVDITSNTRLPQSTTTDTTLGERGLVLAVCDGMGGAAAGEVASKMAIDTIHEQFSAAAMPKNRDEFAQRLSAAIGEAGARIYLAAKANRDRRGMGTTSTVAGIFGNTLFVGQVGDSRAYLWRKGKFKQITRDQSLVWKLIEAGQLTEEEAETYEHAHIILQALGTSDSVAVDLSFLDLRKGDAVIICSDGLSGMVTAPQMKHVLETLDEPADCCRQLIELANEAGGHDNVTAIVARFDGALAAVADGEDAQGYQAYDVVDPIELLPAGKASASIKFADLPPPGKDVKNMVSMRPPAFGRSTRSDTLDEIDEGTGAGPRPKSRATLAVVLLVLAILLLGIAVIVLWKSNSSASALPEQHSTLTTR